MEADQIDIVIYVIESIIHSDAISSLSEIAGSFLP